MAVFLPEFLLISASLVRLVKATSCPTYFKSNRLSSLDDDVRPDLTEVYLLPACLSIVQYMVLGILKLQYGNLFAEWIYTSRYCCHASQIEWYLEQKAHSMIQLV